MSTYTIKLEDKAAFINRLDKLGIGVDSYEIKDDKLKGAFDFTVGDPVVDKIVKTILKQSPKINTIKEMKITKQQLAEIIREELATAKKKKVEEQQVNESALQMAWDAIANNWESLMAIPVIGSAVVGALKALGRDAAEVKKNLMAKGVSEEDADELSKKKIFGAAQKSLQSFGDR
jgi:hypothetical protein